MKKKIPFYAWHILVCITFMLLPYAFTSTGSIFNLPNLSNNGHDRIYFLIYFLLLLFFYFNYYYLIPIFFFWISTYFDHPERNFLDFGKRMPLHNKMPHSFPPNFDKRGGPPTQYSHTILVYLIGVISSLLFAINNQLRKVEKEKMQSELS